MKTDLLNIVRNINNFKIQRYNDNLIKVSSTVEEMYIPMILLNNKIKQSFKGVQYLYGNSRRISEEGERDRNRI